ncbi:hypothetical protein ACTFIY_002001 [Dictyostelium cf. discoideum]
MVQEPIKFKEKVQETPRRHTNAHVMKFWDYGNSFLFEASRANTDIINYDTDGKESIYPMSKILWVIYFHGYGLFCWVCTSGNPKDSRISDLIVLVFAFNKEVTDGTLSTLVVIIRDHNDVSGTDAPWRDSSNIKDGPKFCSDMAIHIVIGNSFKGATRLSVTGLIWYLYFSLFELSSFKVYTRIYEITVANVQQVASTLLRGVSPAVTAIRPTVLTRINEITVADVQQVASTLLRDVSPEVTSIGPTANYLDYNFLEASHIGTDKRFLIITNNNS